MLFGTYNILLPATDRTENMVYNTLSETCVTLEDSVLDQLRIGVVPPSLTEEQVQFLEKSLYIIQDRAVEKATLLYLMNQHRYGNTTLNLRLYTTYQCNFACTYCYESQAGKLGGGHMTDETADSVIEWVRSYIEGRGIRDICWTFYGGEPLLNMDQTVRLGYGLKEVCEQNSLGYSTRIVTNGSLLNSEIIQIGRAHV